MTFLSKGRPDCIAEVRLEVKDGKIHAICPECGSHYVTDQK